MAHTQKIIALIVGVILILMGVWGFLSKGTVWPATVRQNVTYLATGSLCLLAGLFGSSTYAALFNKSLGVLYIALSAIGFGAPSLMKSIIGLDTTSRTLYLGMGAVLAGTGFGVNEVKKKK